MDDVRFEGMSFLFLCHPAPLPGRVSLQSCLLDNDLIGVQKKIQCSNPSSADDRINELEQSINDLRTEMGVEGSPSPLSTSKKPDEPKTEEGSA
ncbi:hypothetical protein L1987_59482 [Smallanthus sonchifolius]|uniref:Uncharacterized protein n=1 Tax=Smallanthus sonchifolius TaxID=185202 RepID=A0ACB9D5C4_9ASTR|nr:hypothetical protein L1987_59482 [Smallanthus sonchifolius]